MPRYKLTIEYHGAPFVGWQRQENGPSAQSCLEAALAALGEADPCVVGAGRTDAGVHAMAQVAHADLTRDWDPFRLSEALNYHLKPNPVAVLAAERVADDFHARFSAIERRYLYRIVVRRAPLAIEKGLAWRLSHDLDPAAMHAAAQRMVGRHDFTTFRSSQCQAQSPVKTLDALDVDSAPLAGEAEMGASAGIEIRIHARARSFLHNQVRSLVGTLERVGAGKWSPDDVSAALAAQDRSACGPVAPPFGLYLMAVGYPPGAEADARADVRDRDLTPED